MTVQEDNTAERNPPSLSIAEAVIAHAKQQLGKPYKIGTEGPTTFDCSGLVWDCFDANGAGALIGGGRHRARWYDKWFTDHGQFTTDVAEAKRGDLVVYGHPGAIVHMGIYLGPRRKRVISALENPYGVTKHTYNELKSVGGKPLPVAGFCKVTYP